MSAFMSGAAKSACGTWTAAHQIEAFCELADVKQDDVLYASWTEQTFQPAFVIFFDHKLHWLVIAVRGSSEWTSVLTDIAADTCSLADGCAHKGMVRGAKWIFNEVQAVLLSALKRYPSYQVVCTGHSLGANVACVLALLLREGEGCPILEETLTTEADPFCMSGEDVCTEELPGLGEFLGTGDEGTPVELPGLGEFLGASDEGTHMETFQASGSSRDGLADGGVATGVDQETSKAESLEGQPRTFGDEVSMVAENKSDACSKTQEVPQDVLEADVTELSEEVPGRSELRSAVAYGFGTSPLMSPLLSQRCMPFIMSFARNADFVTRLSTLSVDRLILELTENSGPKLVKNWFVAKFGNPQQSTTNTPKMRAFGDPNCIAEVLTPPGTMIHIDSRSPFNEFSLLGYTNCDTARQMPNLYWAMPLLYSEFSITFQMFKDHLPILYVEDLLHVIREGCSVCEAANLVLAGRSTLEGAEHCVLLALRTLILEQAKSPECVEPLVESGQGEPLPMSVDTEDEWE